MSSNLRFEIKDRQHPTLRGKRFATLLRAKKELIRCIPAERFYIWDRELQEAAPT